MHGVRVEIPTVDGMLVIRETCHCCGKWMKVEIIGKLYVRTKLPILLKTVQHHDFLEDLLSQKSDTLRFETAIMACAAGRDDSMTLCSPR